MYEYDKRVVLTLDAGGTNFVFSAIQGNSQIIAPISFHLFRITWTSALLTYWQVSIL